MSASSYSDTNHIHKYYTNSFQLQSNRFQSYNMTFNQILATILKNASESSPLNFSCSASLSCILHLNSMFEFSSAPQFWIPSHVNIPGNDRADAAAKKALKNPVTNLTIPYSDFRSKVSRYLVNCWQSSWSMETANKWHSINRKVNTRVPIHSSSRREDVVITRLRLGHTHLTHSFLLSNSLNPPCPFCGIDTSIHHILITCPLYDNNRSLLSSPNSVSSLFRENSSQTIIKLIRNSGLFL